MPYIDIALEAFGPSRLIFGSDWPVSSQAVPYARVCEVVLAGNARAIHLAGAEPVSIRHCYLRPSEYDMNDKHEYVIR